jgi:hypothetical protein
VAGCNKRLTFDNGLKFSGHAKISAATGAKIFFARPYHSWERGVNEQTNGLVRQYFPKGSCFQHLTQAHMHPVEEKLNNRSRRVLDYRTPQEVWDKYYTRRAVALRIEIRGFLSSHIRGPMRGCRWTLGRGYAILHLWNYIIHIRFKLS